MKYLSVLFALAACSSSRPSKTVELLNVSYDPTRELYQDVNAAFAKQYASAHGVTVTANVAVTAALRR